MHTTNKKRFRPYQAEASDAIVNTWDNFQSCIAVIATGGGKTLVAAGTTAKLTGKVLFLANRNELCAQPLAVFHEQTGTIPALEKAESYAPLDAQVVIGSVQTLCRQKRLERFPLNHFDYIFADECHGAVADSWRRIFGRFPNAKLCGITATPFRSDNRHLTDVFATEAYRKGLFALVDDGYLVAPDKVERLSTAISLANVRIKQSVDGKDYDLNDAADAIAPYFETMAEEIHTRFNHLHILAFLPLIASSQKFVAACVKAGINAVHVDGEDKERDEKLQAFKDGKITLLSNSNMLHTGVDMPICNSTLNLRPTRSKVLFQQIIGRSTRTVPGLIDNIEDVPGRLRAIAGSSKPVSYIIDPLWQSLDHDLVTPAFLVAQNQEEAEELNGLAGESNSYSLRDIQKEREEKIAARLKRAANFREGCIPVEYFASATGNTHLFPYEPIYAWEKEPIRRFSKERLEHFGIDPAGVKTEGHARAICKAVGVRYHNKLAKIPTLAVAAERDLPDIWDLTESEARQLY